MTQITKLALEEALKETLLHKPLDKIKISDLTDACGVSRMTFYYHFKDIYDLVEWSCARDAALALGDHKTYDTWQEGLLLIFDAVKDNKPFIMNVWHSTSMEQILRYLNRMTYGLLIRVVEEAAAGTDVSEQDKDRIARFYTHGFVGTMLDWIAHDMQEDPRGIVDSLALMIKGNIPAALHRYAARSH